MSIFNEAVLDAKKIRDAAETAARNKIMESIAPQIRSIINSRIMNEQSDELFNDDDDFDLSQITGSLDNMTPEEEEEAINNAADVSVFTTGDVNIDTNDSTVSESFKRQLKRDFFVDTSLIKRYESIVERVKRLSKSTLSESKSDMMIFKNRFDRCIQEANLLTRDIDKCGKGSQPLKKALKTTIMELNKMRKRNSDRNQFRSLFEQTDDFDMMEQDDTADVDAPKKEVDVDAASSALRDLGAALGLDVEFSDDSDEGSEDDDSADMGDESEDLDLDEADDKDLDEADDKDLEEVYEIDESVLRRELTKMIRQNGRKVQEASLQRSPATEKASQFGGGKVLEEPFEVDEDTFLNVLADELGSVKETRRRASGTRMQERRSQRNRQSTSSSIAVKRAMQEAAVYKRSAKSLKSQLIEMNLFNAKLLYANKLLQNKNLSEKQQRTIVNALDNAKNIREAKLLYKSLSESLTKKVNGNKNLSESNRRTLGSSSKPTRSGAASGNNGDGMDARWGVLAGISGKE